jgi:hypothetical protein
LPREYAKTAVRGIDMGNGLERIKGIIKGIVLF